MLLLSVLVFGFELSLETNAESLTLALAARDQSYKKQLVLSDCIPFITVRPLSRHPPRRISVVTSLSSSRHWQSLSCWRPLAIITVSSPAACSVSRRRHYWRRTESGVRLLMMLVCFLHATRWVTFCDACGLSVCMCVCEQQDNSLRIDKTWDMGNIDHLETHIPNLVDL